jgi:Lar family restriction alleviation protein
MPLIDELLPCPFCGGDAKSFHHILCAMPESWHVECVEDNCGCGTCHHDTEADALASWNTRQPAAKP